MITSKNFLSKDHEEDYPVKSRPLRKKKEPLQISLHSDLDSEEMSENGTLRQY
jgi:hypothetical protein